MVWVATTFKYVFDIRPSAAPGPHEAVSVARAAAAAQFAYPLKAHTVVQPHRRHVSHAAQHRRQFAYPMPSPHRDELSPDVHFCTADLGWVTGAPVPRCTVMGWAGCQRRPFPPAGHSYICYGPLLNGAHTLLFEGARRPCAL